MIQILKEDAVERWAEFSFSYEPRHERLTVNWVRVVKPDGTVLSDKPGIAQDADVPAPMNDPVYVEQKVRRLSLPNVRPGTLVDYSYTVEELKPFRAGDFFAPWRVNPGTLVRRSRLLLDTPVGLVPRVVEQNLTFRPTTVTANGRRLVAWAAQDVPKIEPEPFAADSNGVDMRVDVGAPAAWREIGAWYAGLARDRYAMTPELERKLSGLVKGARTLDDSIKAVHKYVTRDVRYVAISLRMGGYQPHAAADVVATGYGDCKDKATLFITLMKRMGITAYPVLLSAGGRVVRRSVGLASRAGPGPVRAGHPSRRPDRGDHHAGERSERDPQPDEHGGEPGHRRLRQGAGRDDHGRRAGRRVPLHPRQLPARLYFTGPVPSPPGEWCLSRVRGRQSAFQRRNRSGRRVPAILSLPFLRRLGDVKPLVAELLAYKPRRFPIDVTEVAAASGGNGESRLQLELPEGWRAELPKNIALSGAFGDLAITYAQAGRIFTVTERRVGRRGVLPPGRLDDLVAWFEQVAAATRESASIVLRR